MWNKCSLKIPKRIPFCLQIDRISGIAAKYVSKPMLSYPHGTPRSLDIGFGSFGPQPGLVGDLFGANDLLRSVSGPTEADKPMIIELAVAAMEEMIRMAQAGEPLWIPSPDKSTEILSEEDYVQTFPRGIGPKPLGLKSEASRESAVVIMNHISLVEILMDVVGLTSFPYNLKQELQNVTQLIEELVFVNLLIDFIESMDECFFGHCFEGSDFGGSVYWSGREL